MEMEMERETKSSSVNRPSIQFIHPILHHSSSSSKLNPVQSSPSSQSDQLSLDRFDSFDQIRVIDLKHHVRANYRIDYPRQRLTTTITNNAHLKPTLIVLSDDHKSLVDYGIHPDSNLKISVKDLGPQISWRTVFLVEYLGPLLIHPLFYTSNPISNTIYGRPIDRSRLQTLAFAMVILHFLKRELETIWVHRFSNATMPFRNLFKNSFHYWVLSGFLLAAPIYGAQSSASNVRGSLLDSTAWLVVWSAVWVYAELSNLAVHLHLRSLRPAGSKTRKLPIGGYGFKYVSSPNYLFESIGWLAYTALVGFRWPACLFTIISFGQMSIWSIKKLKAYRSEFGDRVPDHWKSIIPFIL